MAAAGTKGRTRTVAQIKGDRKRSQTNKMKAVRKSSAAYSAYTKRKRSKQLGEWAHFVAWEMRCEIWLNLL